MAQAPAAHLPAVRVAHSDLPEEASVVAAVVLDAAAASEVLAAR